MAYKRRVTREEIEEKVNILNTQLKDNFVMCEQRYDYYALDSYDIAYNTNNGEDDFRFVNPTALVTGSKREILLFLDGMLDRASLS